MNTRSKFITLVFAILLLGLLGTLLPTMAQDQVPHQVLTLQVSAVPNEPPTTEETADGGIVFKVNPVGTATGDLEGAFSQRITQVESAGFLANFESGLAWLEPITTFFTIETEEGVIEGYYSGAFYFPENAFPSDAVFQQHGQVLSVTAAYSDLYLADVYYDGIVDFNDEGIPLGDSGTLIIAPR